MAERRTFSTEGAMRLFVARRIWIASPAFWPRMRSTTSRAFWGDVRMYRASAFACMRRLLCLRRWRGRSRGRRCLLRGGFGRVSLELPGGRKLAQLVANHVFGDVHRD